MAYSHNQTQVLFASGMTATASGDKAAWLPGYMPHIVRAAGIIITTTGSVTSGVVIAYKHISMASGATASDLAVLTMTSGTSTGGGTPTTALIAGNVMYKDGLNVKVTPGQKVVLNVRAAATGVSGFRGWLWVEPSWEAPLNNTVMFFTT